MVWVLFSILREVAIYSQNMKIGTHQQWEIWKKAEPSLKAATEENEMLMWCLLDSFQKDWCVHCCEVSMSKIWKSFSEKLDFLTDFKYSTKITGEFENFTPSFHNLYQKLKKILNAFDLESSNKKPRNDIWSFFKRKTTSQ